MTNQTTADNLTERDRILVYEALTTVDPDTLSDNLHCSGHPDVSAAELDDLAARFLHPTSVQP